MRAWQRQCLYAVYPYPCLHASGAYCASRLLPFVRFMFVQLHRMFQKWYFSLMAELLVTDLCGENLTAVCYWLVPVAKASCGQLRVPRLDCTPSCKGRFETRLPRTRVLKCKLPQGELKKFKAMSRKAREKVIGRAGQTFPATEMRLALKGLSIALMHPRCPALLQVRIERLRGSTGARKCEVCVWLRRGMLGSVGCRIWG